MTDKKTRSKIKKKTVRKKRNGVNPQANLYDIKGKIIGKVTLPKEIFAVKAKPELIAQAVRVHLANKRAGTHATKTRAEVRGSKRKIYRQKGTGRARHGDKQAPIFRGGGIAHGPKRKDYSLNLSKKQKRLALFGVLTEKLTNGQIIFIEGLDKIKAKTKDMVNLLDNLKLIKKKDKKKSKTLLVLSEKNDNISLAGRNLDFLSLNYANHLHAYTVLWHKHLIIEKQSITKLTDTFLINSKYQLLEENENSLKEEKQDIKTRSKTAASFRPSRVDISERKSTRHKA